MGWLEQVFALLLFQIFHDFGDVLGAIARADKESVRRFDDDEVVDADGSDEFRWAPEEVARGVKHVARAGENVFAVFLGEEFVDGCPGADIAPGDFRWDDKNLRRAGLLRGALENRVVDGNVFEFGINRAKFLFVSTRTNEAGKFF